MCTFLIRSLDGRYYFKSLRRGFVKVSSVVSSPTFLFRYVTDVFVYLYFECQLLNACQSEARRKHDADVAYCEPDRFRFKRNSKLPALFSFPPIIGSLAQVLAREPHIPTVTLSNICTLITLFSHQRHVVLFYFFWSMLNFRARVGLKTLVCGSKPVESTPPPERGSD